MTKQIHAPSAVGGRNDSSAAGVKGADEGRFRIGLVFLVLGILLVLWAWGNWLYRASTPEPAVSIVRTEDAAADTVRVEATTVLPQILIYTLVLVFLVLFGSYAVVRMVRRYRESADRERAGPSASQDAWAMHKLPDYDRDEDRVK